MSKTMEPRDEQNKTLTLKIIYSLLLLLFAITEAGANHIDAVSCSQRADCLVAINEEIVDTIRSHMHNETNACENFWDYACGEWTAAPYYDHVDTFGAIGNFYRQQLSAFLSKEKQEEEKVEMWTFLDKMRIYYAACMATGSYFLYMAKYFQERPSMPNVDWPTDLNDVLLKSTKRQVKHFNWVNVIAELRRYGLNDVLLSEDVGFAANNSRRYVVELKMPDLADEFHSKMELLHLFEEFSLMQGTGNETKLQLAADIYALEAQLSELRAKHSQIPQSEYMMSLAELRTKLGTIDWQSYFSILLGEQASQTLPIELENIGYMYDLAALLAETDDHIISSYILMRLCKYLLVLSPRITARNCVEHMEVHMALGVDFLYDQKLYKSREEDEKAIGNIFERLKCQFLHYLQQNKLQLSTEENEYLRQKLLKMDWRLGNLPQIKHVSFFNDYYSDANISNIPHSFFRNHWEMLRHRTHRQHKALLKQDFKLAAYFVNDDIRQVRNAPYFVHQRNLLIVPLNFVQLPFYDHRLHPLLQQSLMGWILAHEINHGFEVDGIVLDADGNESSLGEGIKQHNQFKAAVQCMRSTRTTSLIERMADINGFQLAYDAFFVSLGVSSQFPEYLPFSKHINVKHLYFLNFAQFFCGQLPPAIDHDRDDVRVMQILANMPEFAEVFKCTHDAPENPLNKCQMWR